MAKANTGKRKDEVAIVGGGPNRLVPLPGARNIRTLSARYIADLQEDWEIHGKKALAIYREKFPDRYVENYAMLARVVRPEADVKLLRSMGEELDDQDGNSSSRV